MPLHDLRRARGLTQTQIATAMSMKQSTVSKVERQADMYVSTLRRFIEASGGELRVVARFAEGEIEIDQFRDDGEAPLPTDAEASLG